MAAIKLTPKTYEAWKAFLGNKPYRKVENNTEIAETPGAGGSSFSLYLHGNLIAEWTKDGLIKLSDGGYKSNTTKARLNQFVPVSIYQKDYIWYIGAVLEGHVSDVPFENGVTVRVNEITGRASIVK